MNGMARLSAMPKTVASRTEFGARLRLARQKAKLTQAALAQMVGVAQGTVAELESIGHGSSYAAQLASACRVRVEWLTTGDGAMTGGGLSDDLAELAAQIDVLPPRARAWVLEACRSALETVTRKPPADEGDADDLDQPRVRKS